MSDKPYDVYDADYFLRGRESGKSLYEDYRWLPDLTIPMVKTIVNHCGIKQSDLVLDYGCARGYVVRAFRELGYQAYGFDTSRWAVENADPTIKSFVFDSTEKVFPNYPEPSYDWIIAKDVLEHIQYVQLVINGLMASASTGLFVVVPLIRFGTRYVIEEYEKDITHCQRRTLMEWVDMFLRPGWSVEASYRVQGVKDNYWKPGWEYGNGFITVRRIKETP